MDPNDDTLVICGNCSKQITRFNLQTHTIYCVRNITKCPECDDPVISKDLDQHIKQIHSKTQCKCCEMPLTKSQVKDHEAKTCAYRPILCSYCENYVTFKEYYTHQNQCGSRTTVCDVCGGRGSIRNKMFHAEICGKRRVEPAERMAGGRDRIDGYARSTVATSKSDANLGVMASMMKKVPARRVRDVQQSDGEQDMMKMAMAMSLQDMARYNPS